jgi:hypothetical protein
LETGSLPGRETVCDAKLVIRASTARPR